MAIRDIFKVSRKTFFNPSGWIDLDSIKQQNSALWSVLRGLFSLPKPQKKETFEEAMTRLNLTEKEVKHRGQLYRYYAIAFAILGIFTLLYSFYHLFINFYFISWLLGTSVAGIFFAQAFRYDFWSFQIRKRKLGATFTEWKRAYMGHKGARK